MTLNVENLKAGDFKEPMVIFPLKQYEDLMSYIEDMEDRLAITDRMNDQEISNQDFDKLFVQKFGNK